MSGTRIGKNMPDYSTVSSPTSGTPISSFCSASPNTSFPPTFFFQKIHTKRDWCQQDGGYEALGSHSDMETLDEQQAEWNGFVGDLEASQRFGTTEWMSNQEKAILAVVGNFLAFLFTLASPLPGIIQHRREEVVQFPAPPLGQEEKSGSCLQCPGMSDGFLRDWFLFCLP